MEPVDLDNIQDEVFIEDINELTQDFSKEFPDLFRKIQHFLKVEKKKIYITDFIEDENEKKCFYGYFFDALNKKMYQYVFKKNKEIFTEIDINSLTIKDTFSIKVLHLL